MCFCGSNSIGVALLDAVELESDAAELGLYCGETRLNCRDVGAGGAALPNKPPACNDAGAGGAALPNNPPACDNAGAGGVALPNNPPA